MKAIRALKIVLKDTVMSREREYLEEAIKEIEDMQKDFQDIKILFDSEFCRCSKCGKYKRSGFGCSCENDGRH